MDQVGLMQVIDGRGQFCANLDGSCHRQPVVRTQLFAQCSRPILAIRCAMTPDVVRQLHDVVEPTFVFLAANVENVHQPVVGARDRFEFLQTLKLVVEILRTLETVAANDLHVAQRAGPDDHEVIGEHGELGDQVAGHEHRAAAIGEGAQRVAQPPDAVGVEAVRGLVEQQHVGFTEEGAGQGEALAHAEGEAARPLVSGAGGGSRAVVYGLIREGFQRIVVFNRHLHRAEGLVKHFGRTAAHMELRAMPWHDSILESEIAKTKVLINATSIGLTSDASPIPAEFLNDELLVLDLIYAKTRLLRDAHAAGATTLDSELMLLHQGAAAFTLWTGQPAPLELMQTKLAEARAGGLRSAEGEPTGEPAVAAAE